MIKIIEIKESINDGDLIENIYINKNLIKKIIDRLETTNELNYDEYKFLDIIMEKIKINLEKAYQLIKI